MALQHGHKTDIPTNSQTQLVLPVKVTLDAITLGLVILASSVLVAASDSRSGENDAILQDPAGDVQLGQLPFGSFGSLAAPVDLLQLSLVSDAADMLTFEVAVANASIQAMSLQAEERFSYSLDVQTSNGATVTSRAWFSSNPTHQFVANIRNQLSHEICVENRCTRDGAVWLDHTNATLRFSFPYEIIRGELSVTSLLAFRIHAERVTPAGVLSDDALGGRPLPLDFGLVPTLKLRIDDSLARAVSTTIDWNGRQQIIAPTEGRPILHVVVANEGETTDVQIAELGGSTTWSFRAEANSTTSIPFLLHREATGIVATSANGQSAQLHISQLDGGSYAANAQTYYLHAGETASAPLCPLACGPFARKWMNTAKDDATANLDFEGNPGGNFGVSVPQIPAWSSTFVQETGVPLQLSPAADGSLVTIPLNARTPLEGTLSAQLDVWSPVGKCDGANCINVTSIARGEVAVSLGIQRENFTIPLVGNPGAEVFAGSTLVLTVAFQSQDANVVFTSIDGIKSYGGRLDLRIDPRMPAFPIALLLPAYDDGFNERANPGDIRRLDATLVNLGAYDQDLHLASSNDVGYITPEEKRIQLAAGGYRPLTLYVHAPRSIGEFQVPLTIETENDAAAFDIALQVVSQPDFPSDPMPDDSAFRLFPEKGTPAVSGVSIMAVFVAFVAFRRQLA